MSSERVKFRVGCAAVTLLIGLAACNSDAVHDAKRNQDRAEIERGRAETAHAADRQEISKLQSELQIAQSQTQQIQAKLDDANARFKKTDEDLTTARSNQSTADQSAAQLRTTQASLEKAQTQNDLSTKEVQSLNATITAWKSVLAASAAENENLKHQVLELQNKAASATQPTTMMMNK